MPMPPKREQAFQDTKRSVGMQLGISASSRGPLSWSPPPDETPSTTSPPDALEDEVEEENVQVPEIDVAVARQERRDPESRLSIHMCARTRNADCCKGARARGPSKDSVGAPMLVAQLPQSGGQLRRSRLVDLHLRDVSFSPVVVPHDRGERLMLVLVGVGALHQKSGGRGWPLRAMLLCVMSTSGTSSDFTL